MGNLKLNLMMDDELRSQILQLIREQVRPLVAEGVAKEVEKIAKMAASSSTLLSLLTKVVKDLFDDLGRNGWGTTSRAQEFRTAILKACTYEAKVRFATADLSSIVRAEVKKILGGI